MRTGFTALARWRTGSALYAGLLMLGATRAPQPAALDAGLAAFWAASSGGDVARAIEQIVQSGASFDEVYARLAAGRPYPAHAPRGEFCWPLMLPGGAALPTTVVIPHDYDSRSRYPVRVYLHGGVMREAPQGGARRAPRRRLECGEPCIGVYPTGSVDAPWWSATQIESITNLVNTPLYIVKGAQDPMYPVSALEPWAALLWRAGAPVTFRPQMLAGYDTPL